MSDGGLENLFGMTEEPEQAPAERTRKRRHPAVRLLGEAVLITLATVVVVAALRAGGIHISLLLIVATLGGLRLVTIGAWAVRPPAQPKGRARSGSAANAVDDVLRASVRRWERNLNQAQSDPDVHARSLLPVLAEMADERLRLRYGITRASDPSRARELLGEHTWAVLADTGRRAPKARDLETYVEALERL
ncbi:hypothetical protein [Actinoplanes sp. NPDC051851]|uniref:hypothetical protein n=1 Tax=Actinoplanes sp. NPDC051851 TaxID=3154753 RepID=UPI0034393AA7